MRLAKLLLLLLIVGVCHAQPLNIDDVREDNEERDAWLAGVFTPQPLRPAPWQLGEDTAPAPSDGLQVPGVGELHGLRGYKTIKNRPIDAFLGVRYAYFNASGLGRFQAAEAAAYQGHIDATSSKGNCAQFPELQRLQEAEARGEDVDDCLFLDIYAPAGARDLPVLVFVHGEMLFDGGAEEAQPDYVLEHDVILVSVNYRLAPFGFLSALSDQLPGNVALSDLHLALQWVQRNIGYFGGRASQVTLIGQAGGATLAHALSLSPRTQHLFQQLILQSGTALNPYLIDERPLDTLLTFARFARCPTPAGRNLSPLYECLAGLSTSQLVAAFEQLLQQNEKLGLTALGGFKLVIGDRLGYLPEHPAALVVSNSNNNRTKPLIVGATKDAGAFILSRFYEQVQGLRSQNLSDYINLVLRHTAPPQHHKIWHDWALREIFEPGQEINVRGVTQGLLELINLILYRAPVINSIRLSYRKSPAYLYTFDYRGEYHRFGHLDNPLPFAVDASLSDDSVYLFPYPVDTSRLNPEDLSLARALTAMWVNFAADGIPNPNANVWPKASSEYGPFLRFTNSRENTLELDQHFGEGINIPNLYPQYFRVNTTIVAPTRVATIPVVINPVPPTTTTTTTTRRPYVVYTTPRQPIRPQPRPDLRRPLTGTHYTRVQQMELELEEKRLRELQARDEQLRREQQQREQLQREQQQREEQLRREQLQRELEQREQLQREEQRQRELQQQQEEEYLRAVQEQEQKEREQRQREQFDRNQVDGTPAQETEPQVDERDPYEALIRHEEEEQKRLREQYEREQHERNQSQEPQPQDDDREREEQDLLRQQYEREQREREQYEREQQRELGPQADDREQEQQREAALRRQQAEREQYEREREREQFPESPVEELDPYEEQRRQQEEEQRREQQQRDQYEREQQEREPDQESQPQEDDQERDLLREAQLRREQAERDQYEWEQRRREQYERDQQQREEQEQEQDQELQPQEDDRERELQRQEQLRREQAEREEYEWQRRQQLQQEQEGQLRENQQLERESQEEHQEEEAQWDNQGNQGNREQQEGQVEAEQPTQSEGPQVEDFATYNEYVEAYSAWVESYAKQQEGRLNQVPAAASNNDPADPYDADDY